MTLKERFIAWAEKRDKKITEQDSLMSRFRRNRSYHRYFEGYTEYTQLNEKGTLKIVRVYTGQYYRDTLSTPMYALARIGAILLWAASAFCMVSATIGNFPYNYTWYVTVAEALGFPALAALMIAVFAAALQERKLKIRQYRTTHVWTVYIAFIGAAIHLLTAINMCINIFITGLQAEPGIWWGPVRMVMACICFLACGLIEKNISYESLENPEKPRPGGIEIQR